MSFSERQKQLLYENITVKSHSLEIKLSPDCLKQWQKNIHAHQTMIFNNRTLIPKQTSLFPSENTALVEQFEPLSLTPLSLDFWRWPSSSHHGPAIYLVMDRPEDLDNPIILYIGETIAAEKRWKGEHDCKNYLASYSEALCNAGLKKKLSIRFWSDVPRNTRSRREVEQLLIQYWLPPFNKETRERWKTPFTHTDF